MGHNVECLAFPLTPLPSIVASHPDGSPRLSHVEDDETTEIRKEVEIVDIIAGDGTTSPLKTDNFNVNCNYLNGDGQGEKVEQSEKEIARENVELKNNILLLRSQLEEKEKMGKRR